MKGDPMALSRPVRPPAKAELPHLPLMRLPAKGDWLLGITCWELFQVETHFIGRRTLPCVTENCPGCEAKKPRRYEAYLSGIRAHDKRHILVALTPGAAHQLLDAVSSETQLRGHVIRLVRQGTRPNGMLRLELQDHMLDQSRMPNAPDLEKHMLAIWGLDQSHTAQDHGAYAEAVKHAFDSTDENADA